MTARRMLVATTGGTLGMVRSGRFFSVASDQRGMLLAALEVMPGWHIDVEQVGSAGDSADATPDSWFAIADQLASGAPGCDAVVLIHGTDTLAYTAAALALLWPVGAPPLVITGSQVPLGEPGSDARDNLRLAIRVAALSSAGEVLVAFGGAVLPAFGVSKVSAQDARAFVSPVSSGPDAVPAAVPAQLAQPVAALVAAARMALSAPDAHTPQPAAHPTATPPQPAARPAASAPIPPTVVVLAAFPGLDAELVRRVLSPPPQALVLECYGAGTFPLVDGQVVDALQDFTAGGAVLVCTTRCVYGEVVLGTYESGQTLRNLGASGAGSVPTEAAVAALHVLLRAGFSGESIAALPWDGPAASVHPAPRPLPGA